MLWLLSHGEPSGLTPVILPASEGRDSKPRPSKAYPDTFPFSAI